jgi:hypothetical protein
MKRVMVKTFFLILMACALAMATNAMSADVYKVVDEDGNVSYTDKPPPDGSKPIKLAPISVVEAPTYEQPKKADAEGEESKEMTLGYLRNHYSDFAIVSPQQEESVWHPEAAMPVAWSTRYQLQEGMQVTVYVDGKQIAKTSDQIIPVSNIERGEHKVEAQLTDTKNRRIATAEPVTFFVRRPGLYNRARGG